MNKIDVRGVNPPDSDPSESSKNPTGLTKREIWEEGERKACAEWERDLYGVFEDENKKGLGAKRRKRGWTEESNEKVVVWEGEGKEVRGFLEWRGGRDGREVFPGRLPWEEEEEEK